MGQRLSTLPLEDLEALSTKTHCAYYLHICVLVYIYRTGTCAIPEAYIDTYTCVRHMQHAPTSVSYTCRVCCVLAIIILCYLFVVVSADQVSRLYERFQRLDRDNSGSLSPEEFLSIPEFAMNPFALRILRIFQEEQQKCEKKKDKENAGDLMDRVSSTPSVSIDFPTFVKTLSVFSSTNLNAKEKLSFAFRVYDVNGRGALHLNDLFHVLKMMVGEQLDECEIKFMAEDILSGSSSAQNYITYEDFCKVLAGTEAIAQMSITI